MSLQDIRKTILSSKKIGITYHVSPDGDAVGSALALYQGLLKLNKDVYLISKDELAEYLRFLPCSEKIDGKTIEPLEGTDLVIGVDCGDLERLSADLDYYRKTIINIDHHISNKYYGDINFVDTAASAAAEIIYALLEEMKIEIDIDMGTCLYTSLVTDTGSFRHSNVTERTLLIVSKLKSIGVNNTYIYTQLFDNKKVETLRATGAVLNKMELLCNGKLALMIIDEEQRSIILIKQNENAVKASLRSKNNVDVRKIAEALGGGGHIKASGVTFKDDTLEEAKEKLLTIIQDELRIWTA